MSAYQALPSTEEVNLNYISKNLKEMSVLVKNLKGTTGSIYQATLDRIKSFEANLADIFENGKPIKEQRPQFKSLEKQFNDLQQVVKGLEETYARRSQRQSIYASVQSGLIQHDELVYQNEEEIENQILQEKYQAAEEIHKDIVKLNEMFKDVAGMVHEQGEDLNRADAHVEVAVKSTEKSNQELASAKEYQDSACRKKCYLICAVLFLILISVGYFMFYDFFRQLKRIF